MKKTIQEQKNEYLYQKINDLMALIRIKDKDYFDLLHYKVNDKVEKISTDEMMKRFGKQEEFYALYFKDRKDLKAQVDHLLDGNSPIEELYELGFVHKIERTSI